MPGLSCLALVMGGADSLWTAAREVAAIDLAKRSQRDRVISGLHGVHTIGAAFSPFVGGWLTEQIGFEAGFAGYATSTALAVPLGFAVPNLFVPRSAEKVSPESRRWNRAAIARRLRGVVDRYREIHPWLRPTYCAIDFATWPISRSE